MDRLLSFFGNIHGSCGFSYKGPANDGVSCASEFFCWDQVAKFEGLVKVFSKKDVTNKRDPKWDRCFHFKGSASVEMLPA